MPSAISRPSEPVEMASTSMVRSLAPSRMIEPLPKFLSIWARAASSAFCLSMFPPSSTRRTGFSMAAPLFHELQIEAKRDSSSQTTKYTLCSHRQRRARSAEPSGPQRPGRAGFAGGRLALLPLPRLRHDGDATRTSRATRGVGHVGDLAQRRRLAVDAVTGGDPGG